jgi:hypothetical protein
VTILQVLDDPHLFGARFPAFGGPWRAFLAAGSGLPFEDEAKQADRLGLERKAHPVPSLAEYLGAKRGDSA